VSVIAEPRVSAPPPTTEPKPASGDALYSVVLPLGLGVVCLAAWHLGIQYARRHDLASQVLPTPWEVVVGIADLAQEGKLLKYTVSSLFRVTWAYLAAVVIGIPLGLAMGWFARFYQALNPLLQVLRPISPIAWMSPAIIWFGLTDSAPIFMIFLSSLFPIALSATAAVRNIQTVYIRAAQNFGLSRVEMFRRVILPATLPQILTGLRIALGIAWLVVVAAEMIVINPQAGGLGFLIIDAGNQGARYDLVIAGMVLIGLIGLVLDLLVRQLEKFDEVRWGYAQR
jgi:NitT/TauT family transport system permease protein